MVAALAENPVPVARDLRVDAGTACVRAPVPPTRDAVLREHAPRLAHQWAAAVSLPEPNVQSSGGHVSSFTNTVLFAGKESLVSLVQTDRLTFTNKARASQDTVPWLFLDCLRGAKKIPAECLSVVGKVAEPKPDMDSKSKKLPSQPHSP